MSEFKKGDLVVPTDENYKAKAVGVVLKIGRQDDGRTHQVLWVDPDGCFESWHYENGISLYKKEFING